MIRLLLTLALIGASALAAGVRVEICEEGVPKSGWPVTPPRSTETFSDEAFGLFELPLKYVATGVRADRAFPTLVRATASVTLPAGKHRLLLRARGTARLSIGGRVMLETPFDQPRQFAVGNAGELPVEEQDTFLELGPGVRYLPPGNREALAEVAFDGGATEVVLETLIGGIEPKSKRPFRPELGEMVVAVALAGAGEWNLLAPGTLAVPYTDAGWAAFAAERRTRFAAMNTAARAARRSEHAGYWEKRRDAARAWLASTPEVAVPALPPGFPAHNPIDHFIAARIARVASDEKPAARAGGVDFFRDIKPVLEASCYSCHQGAKVKGGLHLDSRAAALHGGRGDGPAIVPGNPKASPLFQRITSREADEIMPAKGDPLRPAEVALIERWIAEGAVWPEFSPGRRALTPLAEDLVFLRRVFLDTVGVVPGETEIAAFRADRSADRRARLIDRLLADPRWADHQMGYWLDVLAENPNLINPTLNNTGPFRWWLHEALVDHKPLDLLVTELVRLEGSERGGGPAGFGVASQNDVPAAAKGIILAGAFLSRACACM